MDPEQVVAGCDDQAIGIWWHGKALLEYHHLESDATINQKTSNKKRRVC